MDFLPFRCSQLRFLVEAGAKVFPEVLWDNAELSSERVVVSGDGRLSAVEGLSPLPLLSASLFGRVYSEDAELPLDYCPGQSGESGSPNFGQQEGTWHWCL